MNEGIMKFMESSNLIKMHSFSSSQSPASPFPFVGITALILIYVVILYLFIDFNEDISGTSSRAEACRSGSGLSLEEIRELPWLHCDCEVNSAAICAVCLDGIHKGERCRFFPGCQHMFHAQCIGLWLMRRPTCPTCRSPFNVRGNLDFV